MSKDVQEMNYYSDIIPDFTPREVTFDSIPVFRYEGGLASEIKAKRISKADALRIYECMLTIREFEEMILKLRTGAYEPLADFNYRGPTHLSIGQEATSAGVCSILSTTDYITSTHRGHGDSIAKGVFAVFAMNDDELRRRCPEFSELSGQKLRDAVMEDHVFRTIAELFGKETGYGKGRGGGMHIADSRVGHLGANAIVGGGVPIATGAAMTCRLDQRHDHITACFAGDGAYSNGVVLEALNWAAQAQFTEAMAQTNFGLPVVYCIINNHYGMTGRCHDEVTGVDFLARRAAGFAMNNMHAEVVNGMNPLAVRDALLRARAVILEGKGPVLLEFDTYRYYGHSLSDPRNEYRTRNEEGRYRDIDPVTTFREELIKAGVATEKKLDNIIEKVAAQNARAARHAADSEDPPPADVIKYMYTDTRCKDVPESYANVTTYDERPRIKRDGDGGVTYRDALKEAMIEEMERDRRVVLFGEDVADYGGAFKVTKGLLEHFGRDRVFNTPISEACICGAAVGMAMTGYRPIAELMYMDFALMASDQIANQAGKWHYMVGGAVEVPLVYRVSVGGGKGYGGQHSQSLESMFAHIPGLLIAYPSNPYDAKGLLKTAIRDNNPVMFVESQLLYNEKTTVPEDEYLIPFGEANLLREGDDITIVAWGPAVADAVTAGEQLAAENIAADVIDLRTLVPMDNDMVFNSVKKTGRCVVVSQCIDIGSFTGEIVARVTRECFDYLDSPPVKVGAANGIAPQAYSLEKAFLPNAEDIIQAAKGLI